MFQCSTFSKLASNFWNLESYQGLHQTSMMKLFEKVIKDGKKLTIFGKMIYHRCFSVSYIRFRNSCNNLNFKSQVYLPDILTIFLHFKPLLKNFCSEISQPVSTCSKWTMESHTRLLQEIWLKLIVKYQNNVNDVVLVSILLTLNILQALFWCFHCWLRWYDITLLLVLIKMLQLLLPNLLQIFLLTL